jgi:glutamate-5-semialdehyde dehydrogenase
LVPESKLKKIQAAARKLRLSPAATRNAALKSAADLLIANEKVILKANALDLKALPSSTAPAFRDRLVLDSTRLAHMAESLRQVAALEDPLAGESGHKTLANGLKLKKVRSPLGVIFMIFESRPNVAVEAFSMGFKAGNAMILRGGKESRKTVAALYEVLKKALKKNGISEDVLWGITNPDRKIVNALLTQKKYIDVVVPRGGEGLIEFVVNNSLIPIIKNDRGLCHIYVHSDADLDKAVRILVNAKTQRPAVCNSMETILVHESVAKKLLPLAFEAMRSFNVQWFADKKSLVILKNQQTGHNSKSGSAVKLAGKKNWDTEYLDQIVNCKVVKSVDEAIQHIEEHGSRHSESILTASEATARKFQNEIDAAVVYWNASTRFTDGFEFGLGGELGISTQKLHVRGPVGVLALTNERWIADGTGQTR